MHTTKRRENRKKRRIDDGWLSRGQPLCISDYSCLKMGLRRLAAVSALPRQVDAIHPRPLDRFRAVAFLYVLRVYYVEGFYIVSYGLGIYVLNLLIAFFSPKVDPEIQKLTDGPTLPTRGSDEFRPFVRRLPEFKFCSLKVTACDLAKGYARGGCSYPSSVMMQSDSKAYVIPYDGYRLNLEAAVLNQSK